MMTQRMITENKIKENMSNTPHTPSNLNDTVSVANKFKGVQNTKQKKTKTDDGIYKDRLLVPWS